MSNLQLAMYSMAWSKILSFCLSYVSLLKIRVIQEFTNVYIVFSF